MAKQRQKPRLAATPDPPTVHEAELASGPSGVVFKGASLGVGAAVARRRIGEDIVVCGADTAANRRLAETIESAVGPCVRQDAHRSAGPSALPHFQQRAEGHAGYSFYETSNRQKKARKRR